MDLLSQIDSPQDLKKLSVEQLTELAAQIRQEIISTVSRTGGHLATNLGTVELTLALHYVFDAPRDKLVWDVSHQVYAHKLLTGRRERFQTLRQYGGLAGFTKRSESEYDPYGAGHASTSISAALGLASARDLAGDDYRVVAIIGDGSLTGGLAYEGLNNAGSAKRDLLVVLNDNTWSISKNVGAISKYLTNIQTDEKFNRLRNEIWELTGRFKRRDRIRKTISNLEHTLNSLVVPGMVFQKLGFRYLGPIDGHDLPRLVRTLERIKNLHGPLLLHVATKKGKGYQPAEGDPTRYHGIGKFDKMTGEPDVTVRALPTYTDVFGTTMVELGRKDRRVVAITAAMASGTGLAAFAKEFRERFFDVGIAEGHAGCLAGGLAVGGYRPYLAVYSTFLQRAYDQIVHDLALQGLPVVLCLDRAGLVGEDGPTHHGVFDLSYLSTIPNVTVAAPCDGNELRSMLHYTIEHDLKGPVAIRYPRGAVPAPMKPAVEPIAWGQWEEVLPGGEVAILAVGTMVNTAMRAAELLRRRGIEVWLINARFVKPLDEPMLRRVVTTASAIVTVEENALAGGFGQAVGRRLMEAGYTGRFRSLGIPDTFVGHGSPAQLYREVGLDVEGLTQAVGDLVAPKDHVESHGRLWQKLIFRRNGYARRRHSRLPVDIDNSDD